MYVSEETYAEFADRCDELDESEKEPEHVCATCRFDGCCSYPCDGSRLQLLPTAARPGHGRCSRNSANYAIIQVNATDHHCDGASHTAQWTK